MVGLSELNSNNYANILESIRRTDTHNTDIASNDSENLNSRPGEVEVHQLRQIHKRLSDEEISAVIEGYKSGKTTYQLAKQFGTHKNTISKALKKAGIDPSNSTAQKKLNTEEVIKMYGKYHTTAEIAKLYGVHPNSVVRCLKNHGVALRSRWDYPQTR